MRRSEYTEANRKMWNKTAPVHKNHYFNELLEKFQQPGYNSLDSIETEILTSTINIRGKNVAQLCCNNGRELLSIKNLGAGRCTGFDISDEFITQAKQLVKSSNIECEFFQTDVYEISKSYFNNNYDLIYITIGALGWLPDLDGFFKILTNLLRDKGWLFIYEMHPILDMFENETTHDPMRIYHSYFQTPNNPFIDEGSPDYFDKTQIIKAKSYWFHHKLSDIINGCLKNNFRLVSFQEYDHDISEVYAHLEKYEVRPPLCYSLVAQLE